MLLARLKKIVVGSKVGTVKTLSVEWSKDGLKINAWWGPFCELRLQLIYRVGQTYKNPPLSPVRLRGLLSVQLVLHWLLVDVFKTVGGAKKVKWKKRKKSEGVFFLYKKFLAGEGRKNARIILPLKERFYAPP